MGLASGSFDSPAQKQKLWFATFLPVAERCGKAGKEPCPKVPWESCEADGKTASCFL